MEFLLKHSYAITMLQRYGFIFKPMPDGFAMLHDALRVSQKISLVIKPDCAVVIEGYDHITCPAKRTRFPTEGDGVSRAVDYAIECYQQLNDQ